METSTQLYKSYRQTVGEFIKAFLTKADVLQILRLYFQQLDALVEGYGTDVSRYLGFHPYTNTVSGYSNGACAGCDGIDATIEKVMIPRIKMSKLKIVTKEIIVDTVNKERFSSSIE